MGRSRGNFQADEDPSQRSRRKKNASSGENLDTAPAGQGTSDKALYHCNYCNKDISGKIRIKCAVCSDFDLCIECFSVGAEVKRQSYQIKKTDSKPIIRETEKQSLGN